jgi:hypothetical protein
LSTIAKTETNYFGYGARKNMREKNITHKGDCCFSHIIGLSRKNGIEKINIEHEKLL